MWTCSQQHENRDEAKFCGKCGEKHVVPAFCTECGSVLEPEDVFCTSCGHSRASAAPAPVVAAAAAVAPVEVAAPVVAAAPPMEATPVEPKPVEPKQDEPVTFSFGGATIAMKDPNKPDQAKPAKKGGGMGSAVSAILGFVLIAGVLGLAFYLITR